MPTNSLIVGVDLAPIKSIPRTITFQSDITTDKCRATIRQHLKTWKADTVLHDGAPNVGTAWVQDAFSQAELVLQAMKLATEFLVEGGTFVTKVFRSKDYNALLWVFGQLFTKVEATKPPSSRNVSAEIFVVCRGFKAPKRIDPKFLDPRSVFAELADPTPNNEAKVFNPEKKKRKRDGYEEGDYTQFKEASASEFIQTTDPIDMLGSLNRLSFEQQPNGDIAVATLDKLPETTTEIRDCCADLKVLGRKEFRTLLRWRLKVREKFGFAPKKKVVQNTEAEEFAEIAPMDEELRIREEMQRLNDNESSRKKRERRRENERKQKEIVRMQMHMTTPMEIGLEQAGPNGEDAMFALKTVDRVGALDRVANGRMNLIVNQADGTREGDSNARKDEVSDHEEDLLERELDSLYERYQEQKSASDAKYRAKKSRKEHRDEEWGGLSGEEDGSTEGVIEETSSIYSSDDEAAAPTRSLVTTLVTDNGNSSGLSSRAAMFFEQEIFRNIGGLDLGEDDDSAIELDDESAEDVVDSTLGAGSNELMTGHADQEVHTIQKPVIACKFGSGSLAGAHKTVSPAVHEESDNDNVGFEVVKRVESSEWEARSKQQKNGGLGMTCPLKERLVLLVCSSLLDIDIITAEAMTLAQQIASGEKSKNDLMDEGFNKYAFQDRDGLPEWFLDDEGRHSKPHRPITAAAAAAVKEKLRALNARPIKKVREAKDRKRFKAAQKLEKLRRKSALVADEEGMTEKEKAQNIANLMSKAAKKKPKQQVKLVVARGGNRGISGRPRGVKGKYKIVDARLKKDVRAERRLAKKRK